MIFPYRTIVSPNADGDFLVLKRPEILITVSGASRSGNYWALVDTGSDNSIFPISIAEYLGIELYDEEIPPATAFAGAQIKLLSGNVTIRLGGAGEEIAWTTTVGFFDFPVAKDAMFILGHAGFLEFFTAIFDGKEGRLTLLRNDDLPSAE